MRLIDADALKLKVYHEWIRDSKEIDRVVDSVPTIDAVEVVRCRECKHKYMKDFDMFCPYMFGILKPNMHCSYGEREGE